MITATCQDFIRLPQPSPVLRKLIGPNRITPIHQSNPIPPRLTQQTRATAVLGSVLDRQPSDDRHPGDPIRKNPLRSAKRGTEILLYCCRMGKLNFFREVSVILDWLDGKLDWSIFAVVIPIGGVGIILLSLLTFAWEFDLPTSPVRQVGIFHLALTLLLSITFVVASRRPFSFSRGFRWFTMTVSVLVPTAVFVGSWLVNGPYEGFRG